MSSGIAEGILQHVSKENVQLRKEISKLFQSDDDDDEEEQTPKQVDPTAQLQTPTNETAKGDNTIHSLFLLTDGHANEGICDTAKLSSVTQQALRLIEKQEGKFVNLYCFGFSPNHNERKNFDF